MSATTPGMRHIWMDTVVRCVDQQMSNISDDQVPIARSSSIVDSADSKSDFSGQRAASSAGEMSVSLQADHKTGSISRSDAATVKHCQSVSDKAEPGVTSVQRLTSSVTASTSDSALHTDSQSTDVCCVLFPTLL